MIRTLWRYAMLAYATVAALLVLAGRELHPVLVGGFTKGDPRHPTQARRRIAAMEHAALPGPYEHDAAVCDFCDPEKRREIARTLPSPQREAWVCLDCSRTGFGASTWQSHWVESQHTNWREHDTWDAAYKEAKEIRAEVDRAKARLDNEMAHRRDLLANGPNP